MIPFSQDSYSSAYFSVLEDGTVYAADADGFFRCDVGDTNWQKLLEGIDTSFSMSDQWCRDIVALSDGSVYAWFGSESGDKIMIYRYDPDAVIEDDRRTDAVYRGGELLFTAGCGAVS